MTRASNSSSARRLRESFSRCAFMYIPLPRRARMCSFVDLTYSRLAHMRISLGRGDALMTQQFLHDAQGNRYLLSLTPTITNGLAPQATMTVSFTPPTPADPAPKTPGEYMLVFQGDMGADHETLGQCLRRGIRAKHLRECCPTYVYAVGKCFAPTGLCQSPAACFRDLYPPLSQTYRRKCPIRSLRDE